MQGPNPSDLGVVLIPGAMLGAWIWDRVIGRLARPALAVDLPGRSSGGGCTRRLSMTDRHRTR